MVRSLFPCSADGSMLLRKGRQPFIRPPPMSMLSSADKGATGSPGRYAFAFPIRPPNGVAAT